MEVFWYTKSVKETLDSLGVDASRGLSDAKIEERIKKYGKNTLPKRPTDPWWMIAGRQFASPLVYVLLVGAGISIYVEELLDASVILGAVLLNGVIGFVQEYKANRSLLAIQSAVVFETTVLRDGEEQRVRVEDLVPGDVLMLQAGDRIPADARVITEANAHTNEAALTGESLPVQKGLKSVKKGTALGDRTCMLYMGTTLVQGVCTAAVVGTGKGTELGHIADLIRETGEGDTPLQTQIRKLARLMAVIFVLISGALFVFGLIQGRSLVELLVTSIAVAVAAIPEGLLVAVTVILAIGMQRILKQNAIIKRLVAAETLGSVSVVCTDKTGTLTKAEMTPHMILFEAKATENLNAHTHDEELWKAAVLCNNAFFEEKEHVRTYLGNPTEMALLKGSEKAGYPPESIRKKFQRLFEIPFDSEKKFMSVLEQGEAGQVIFVKGAPEVILSQSTTILNKTKKRLTAPTRKKILARVNTLSSKGYRIIAIAEKKTRGKQKISEQDMNGLVYLGAVVLKDPLRPDAKGVVKRAIAVGIHPVLVTGDHKGTAQAIMHELDLPAQNKHTLTGEELDDLSEKEFAKKLKKISIFARVEPRHKVRIVEAWKKKGEVIAMLGDGVNDAPSLKAADIGIALGSGTDVAKETADIILEDNNFKIVLDAIKQGRLIFQNIRNVTLYLFSDAFTELLLLGGALVLNLPIPVLAGQILWVNIIEDTFPALALAFEKGDKATLDTKPRKRHEPIFTHPMKLYAFGIALLDDLLLFSLFYYYQGHFTDIAYVRTVIFAALGVDTLLLAFAMRNLKVPIWHMNPFSNWYLNISVLIGLAMLLVAIYVPFAQTLLKTTAIRPIDWIWPVLLGAIEIGIVEITKHFLFIRRKKHGKTT